MSEVQGQIYLPQLDQIDIKLTAKLSAWFCQKNMVNSRVLFVSKAKVIDKAVFFSTSYGVFYRATHTYIKNYEYNIKSTQ